MENDWIYDIIGFGFLSIVAGVMALVLILF